mmetsp:Transcript_35117/g.84747  ORF Transcript_35117/g.84747 Transcript_35117/m.84747 type:complete len:210 (-) Transcript_35117:42-671(-)
MLLLLLGDRDRRGLGSGRRRLRCGRGLRILCARDRRGDGRRHRRLGPPASRPLDVAPGREEHGLQSIVLLLELGVRPREEDHASLKLLDQDLLPPPRFPRGLAIRIEPGALLELLLLARRLGLLGGGGRGRRVAGGDVAPRLEVLLGLALSGEGGDDDGVGAPGRGGGGGSNRLGYGVIVVDDAGTGIHLSSVSNLGIDDAIIYYCWRW